MCKLTNILQILSRSQHQHVNQSGGNRKWLPHGKQNELLSGFRRVSESPPASWIPALAPGTSDGERAGTTASGEPVRKWLRRNGGIVCCSRLEGPPRPPAQGLSSITRFPVMKCHFFQLRAAAFFLHDCLQRAAGVTAGSALGSALLTLPIKSELKRCA